MQRGGGSAAEQELCFPTRSAWDAFPEKDTLISSTGHSQEVVVGRWWVWDAEGVSHLDTAPVSRAGQEEDLRIRN